MIVGMDGALWATSDPDFYLREYTAPITHEDGTEKDETINEANNIVKFMKDEKPHQGLRINGKKKHHVIRKFKDEDSGHMTIFTKFPQGGACLCSTGKCILIATFSELQGHKSTSCNEVVQLMAGYLAKSTWPKGAALSEVGATTWQSYVDTMMVGKGNIADALILEISTGKILASTPDFQFLTYETEIPQEDGTDKLEKIDEKLNILKFARKEKPSQGLRVNKVKYQVIRALVDEVSSCYSIHGKKSQGGIGVVNCGKCVLVATFDEKKQHSSPGCHGCLADLAKYLNEQLSK